MIGMEVRHDHRRKPLPAQRSAEDRLPCRPTGVGTKTRVEHRPAIVIFDQIDVHVIESVRQRQPEPPYTRSDLDEYAGRGWLGVGKYQTGAMEPAASSQFSLGLSLAATMPTMQADPRPIASHGIIWQMAVCPCL